MSYGGVENTPEDLDFLLHGTITSIGILSPEEQGLIDFAKEPELREYAYEVVQITVRLKHSIIDSDTKKECSLATFQVWQDAEGNGPGFLSLVGLDK